MPRPSINRPRSEEHTSELQSPNNLVCRLLLEKTPSPCRSLPRAYASPQPEHRPPDAQRRLALCTHRQVDLTARSEPSLARSPKLFFFNDAAPTEIYPLPLHGALPI